MLKTNATNAGMEKAVSKSRKNKTKILSKNDHVEASVGRSKEFLLENSRNVPDRETNSMQKTNETKV